MSYKYDTPFQVLLLLFIVDVRWDVYFECLLLSSVYIFIMT